MKKPNMGKSLIALFLAALMVLTAVPVPASAATIAELKDQISDLKEEKKAMQAEINQLRDR